MKYTPPLEGGVGEGLFQQERWFGGVMGLYPDALVLAA